MMENNALETFTLDDMELMRNSIIAQDDAINAKRIMDYIRSSIGYNNKLCIFRWTDGIRPNNIDLMKKNGFEVMKVTIVAKEAKTPFIVHFILAKANLHLETIYKDEMKNMWGMDDVLIRVVSSNFEKL